MPVKVKMDGLEDSLFSQDGELAKLYYGIRSKINPEKLNQFPSLTAQQRLDLLVGSGAEFKVVPGESIKNLETALEYKGRIIFHFFLYLLITTCLIPPYFLNFFSYFLYFVSLSLYLVIIPPSQLS